ncbi:iron-sulfur cluster carrier protein ApbC [Pseudoteredinibacter isoporae]|uniref:Iron-sulfur cluster carrier protein n=1 Tax=Pseudoteredinibacter isoporae TaxID=570281 RepID=A0A7X0MWD8_9GAMM|nr:iron-sulfur cluster carrier protein ApbC [Pseudoteredinibacter isoporae]MBB6522075.1 ATP-binding protein involved in chromosome partitioning [Pseudoteredinibacter isoporae]NHO87610.1 iron-sulfur cluster carrier protein ApbC [Pseudoteredinibacter isoporae]NIB24059.1 iron-sulfur cluster carrier protein ApbC [Pseudoteredinibacter isoporae]
MNPELSQLSEELLTRVLDPVLHKELSALNCLQSQLVEGERLTLKLHFPYPIKAYQWSLEQQLQQAFSLLIQEDPQIPVKELKVDFTWSALRCLPEGIEGLESVANVIAVASGKGGVGKSSTTVNLALALASAGARVGILDADIYGPSQSHMLGLDGQRPRVKAEKQMYPLEAYGMAVMSMANLVTDKTPMVWRGPMAAGALQQLLLQTAWPELDYLLIDMPPGTGDIQLSLSQKIPLSGALIVTTPQDIALIDALKGIEMFNKVNVPILGVLENMSSHVCSNCGHKEAIFGEGGGERIARQYGIEVLAQLPIDKQLREDLDSGTPTVVKSPTSPLAMAYSEAGSKLAAQLYLQAQQSSGGPELVFSDD